MEVSIRPDEEQKETPAKPAIGDAVSKNNNAAASADRGSRATHEQCPQRSACCPKTGQEKENEGRTSPPVEGLPRQGIVLNLMENARPQLRTGLERV